MKSHVPNTNPNPRMDANYSSFGIIGVICYGTVTLYGFLQKEPRWSESYVMYPTILYIYTRVWLRQERSSYEMKH